MRNLIKRTLDVAIKKNWLNVINKEMSRCNYHAMKYQKSREVLEALVKRYNEIYDTSLEVK